MRYFYVRIDAGFSNSIYSIYYTLPPAGDLALLFNAQGSTLVATGLTYTQLTTGNGVLVEIPNTTERIYLYDASGNFCSVGIENDYRIKSLALPTPTPTPSSTPTPTPTPTENCDFDIELIYITATPTPTPTPTPDCNFEVDLGIVTATPTPTPTPTPDCNFEVDLGVVTATPTPTPTPTPDCNFEIDLGIVTATPTPTPSSTPTPTPTPSPTASPTPTPTPTPSSTPTPTPTPTNNCEFEIDLGVVTATPTPTPTPTGDCTFDIDISIVTATPTPTPTPSPTTNFAPTDITLSNNSINENTATGTTIGTFSASTLDVSDSHTFSLVSGSGDSDNGSFTLTSGGILKNATVPNYESKSSYSIRVRTTDSAGQTFEKSFTINVSNVNETPYALSLSSTSIAENSSINTTIGTFSTSDVDSGDTFTYTLVSGSGDTDNASFNISGSSLRSSSVFNYETKSSYSIRVRTTDAGGLTYEGTFTITVTNVNEAPTNIALSSASISENVPTGTTIGTLSATDPDSGDTFTYSLYDSVSYPDNNSFSISSTTLKTAAIFNYEVKSSYSIRVRVTDAGGLTYDKTITISITDVTISVAASQTTAVTCNGGNQGVITVSGVTGGTANYTYSKDGTNYQVGNTFGSLTAGSYTIYAKDSYGEVGSTSVTVTQPAAVSVSASSTLPTCYGDTDGSISVTSASGGNGSFTYSKDGTNYQAGTTFSNLGNGTYTIYAKDGNGCLGSTSVTLNRTQVTADISQVNVACYGQSTGTITVSNMSGGQGGTYQVKLGSGGTYQNTISPRTYSGLASGAYTIYVKDSAGCERTIGVTITQPASAVSISVSSATAPSCSYGTDGSIVVSGSGGTGTITYSKDGTNYQSSGTFSNLGNGTYTLYAKDENGCIASTTSTITRAAMSTTLGIDNVSCFGGSNGRVYISSVSGGAGTLSQWTWRKSDQVQIRASNYQFTDLVPGIYEFDIFDANGCVETRTVTITQPASALTASITSVVAASSANNDGQMTLSSAGGTWPKTYYLYKDTESPYNDYPTGNLIATYTGVVANDANRSLTNLSCGYYWLLVNDANLCSASTLETSVGCTVTPTGSFTGYYNSTACSLLNPVTIYYVGDISWLTHGQTYYNQNGYPIDGSSGYYYMDGNVYGTINSQGVFTQLGTCA